MIDGIMPKNPGQKLEKRCNIKFKIREWEIVIIFAGLGWNTTVFLWASWCLLANEEDIRWSTKRNESIIIINWLRDVQGVNETERPSQIQIDAFGML